MEKTFSKIAHKERRHRKIRAKISGTAQQLRLCVFRSNQHIYAQLINDQDKKVVGVVSDFEIKKPTLPAGGTRTTVKDKDGKELKGKIATAFLVGQKIAEFAKTKNISKIVFDRGGYQYHGRVEALANGARLGGLLF